MIEPIVSAQVESESALFLIDSGQLERRRMTKSLDLTYPKQALARRRQVELLVQLSRSTIYANVKAGTFPAPVRIGARAVAWRLADVQRWLDARPVASASV